MASSRLPRRLFAAALPALAGLRLDGGLRAPGPARSAPGALPGSDGLITPVDRFFVRDHFQEPDLAIADWKLKVEGHVSQPLEITFSDLLLAPSEQRDLTLECAGNGSPGFAVSTGTWKGVPVSFLLAAAAPLAGAVEVLLEGADEGKLTPRARASAYGRIVPLEQCLAREAMVAYQLNRQLLPRANGFPARALLPGWYAMSSVKWLQRIVVLKAGERPAAYAEAGLDQVYIRARKGQLRTEPLGRLQLKSAIAFPQSDARLLAGSQHIWGFAWGSESPVRGVQVSIDGGENWQSATLESRPDPLLWTRWSLQWDARPGDYTLISRAESVAGQRQPLLRDPSRDDQYELNQCANVTCSVR